MVAVVPCNQPKGWLKVMHAGGKRLVLVIDMCPCFTVLSGHAYVWRRVCATRELVRQFIHVSVAAYGCMVLGWGLVVV